MTATTPLLTGHAARSRGEAIKTKTRYSAPAGLALVAMIVVVVVAAINQPAILSVNGLTIMLTSAVPLVFAVQAQMLVMTLGDIDLSVGSLVGLITVIAATRLADAPLLGIAALLGIVVAYGLLGFIIQKRNVPSIIATLGLSFVWLGIGLLILPTPGGKTPDWLNALNNWRPEWIPAPLVIIAVITAVAYVIMHQTQFGVRARALGSSATTLQKAGWSLTRTRVSIYALAGVLLVLSGLVLASQTQSGDVTSAGNYTLITIAAVILGGGTFSGGQAMSMGATYGAITLTLITVLLSFANLSSNLQSGAQGIIVLLVLAGRVITERIVR